MSDFPFKLEPSDKILFSSSKLGETCCSVVLKVYNTTNETQAFKIKCTSNEFFRLRPPVTIVPPGQEPLSVNVIFNAGKQIPDDGKHFFAVYGMPCESTQNPRTVFNTDKGKKAKSKKLFAEFKKTPEGTEKNDEKKDEDKKEEKKDEEKKEEKKDDEKKEEKKDEEKKEEKKDDDKKDEKKENEKK
uniref:Major sperm protein n=1 Tax=Strongyloides papillosus TaxID=174720 RepID=A0A0N5B6S4_STREA